MTSGITNRQGDIYSDTPHSQTPQQRSTVLASTPGRRQMAINRTNSPTNGEMSRFEC